AIDQIAGEPEARVSVASYFRMGEKRLQGRTATLQIADYPDVRCGHHAADLLQGHRVWLNRRTLCWFSIRMRAPRAIASAPRLGTRAVTHGAHLLSMPTFSANWFSMKNPTPSKMPIKTLVPTPPRRVCMKPIGAAIVIMTSKVKG